MRFRVAALDGPEWIRAIRRGACLRSASVPSGEAISWAVDLAVAFQVAGVEAVVHVGGCEHGMRVVAHPLHRRCPLCELSEAA